MIRNCKFFLIMFFIAGCVATAFPQLVKGGEQQFRLDYSIEYRNNTQKPKTLKLEVPVVMTIEPHQKINSLEVFPKPMGYKSSDRGKVAEFRFKQIAPGQTVKCGYKCVISTRRLIWNIDADKVGKDVPAALSAFCKPEARIPVNDPAIKNIVKQVGMGEPNPYYRLWKFYDFIRNFRFQLTNQAAPVLTALSKRTVQCSDAAELLITMCRASGIPARYNGGFFLKESETILKETHAWAEIYLPGYGWVPVDPTMGRFDDSTRLSRFCEIDSPYIILWKDENNPFVVQNEDNQGNLNISDFKITVSYKALKGRSGISVNEFYPVSGNLTPVKKINTAQDIPQSVKNFYSEADRDYSSGNMKSAEEKLRAAIRTAPYFLPPYRKLVQIYQRSNRLTALKMEFKNAPDNKNDRGGKSYVLGVIDTQLGNFRDAASEFTQAYSRGAEPFIIDYNRGILYTRCKQISKALKYLSLSVKNNPSGAPAYKQFIEIMQYLEDDNSIAALCQYAVKFINTGEFQYEMARAYMGLSRTKDAVAAAEKAVALNPADGRYNAVLGWAYVESGNRSKGKQYIDKAISLGISGEQKTFLLNLLKRGK
ncbi:MAG: tetratricopeptide repeat protein [Firmicutes bacterium]|nr:tetratricopeptide repeat protein [Bacillota bacterium]